MKVSQLFTKTTKEVPRDEVSLNAQLLIRAGYINKLAPGVYSYLPMGLRVIQKIEKIVREEMNGIGGQEILMPALIPDANWKKTGRWEDLDVLFRVAGADRKHYGLGATHEEVLSPLVRQYVNSYKDLPLYIYQIQTKFRNELRAKAGLLRGREFIMKDLYSFHTDEDDLEKYYKKSQTAYMNVFKRVGLGQQTVLTFASGGTFSKYSHEFQTVTKFGEDTIFTCRKCSIAVNKEILSEIRNQCPECGNLKLNEDRAIEVGNIFKLGTKYSSPFGLNYVDKNGAEKPVIMGCYGLGISRLMGAVVETLHDANGIVWPKSLAPFQVYLIDLTKKQKAVKLAQSLIKNGIDVLVDDRVDASPGVKFSDADLLGFPYRAVISNKTGNKIEVKNRQTGKTQLKTEKQLIELAP
ncbi:MAG: prolyl-tRNA synthetase [Candidatus Buchananbacteria bacterium CG10_big_fil_rev_8_21_14_0_10_42_9]|uniref:Proline--tRNA ligase n=1 Tax=Candidatus Buchananbacteria bacterium CG10_big_fil_rev_8_21_14_0_10_42_9 TaxID=1974526 RepID=A0A2H0W2A7_9BACT|nr:MAG: prolyl-tRNA synthetase [Candidatus Buchananbacteria bacterium CG10_big_fil_rev_8_21_14_0_10_42_9]